MNSWRPRGIPLKILLLLIFLILCPGSLVAEEESPPLKLFNYSSFLGQELLIQLPAFNKESVFGPGIGGSLIYENYALGHLFNRQRTLPGIIWGLTATVFNFFPESATNIYFGDSTLLNAGAYTGFQFYIPIGSTVAFSPALFGGIRYYFNFHYFNQTLNTALNPIFIGGIHFNFIFNSTANLSLSCEYELYYESQPAHTLQFSLRTGWYL